MFRMTAFRNKFVPLQKISGGMEEKKTDLNSELDFFIRNIDTFYMLFPDRYVAIKNHQVVALGNTLNELLDDAKARGHELGTFQAQLCGRDASCYTLDIHPLMIR